MLWQLPQGPNIHSHLVDNTSKYDRLLDSQMNMFPKHLLSQETTVETNQSNRICLTLFEEVFDFVLWETNWF